MDRHRGHYLGTVIQGKWWRRYRKDKMLARGSGRYWFDEQGIHFLRYLTRRPIFIPFEAMTGLGIGRWHAGQWALGRPIVKINWTRNGLDLSSGFILARRPGELARLKNFLESEMAGQGPA